MSRIENEVKQYQEEILANETKHNMLELKKMQLELLERRASDEVKLYVSNKVIFWIDSYWLLINIYLEELMVLCRIILITSDLTARG